MANPQLENGYIKIANEIAEAFARHRFSGQEWQVLWVILRKTYGFNKKADEVSLSQFQKLTGMKRSNVVRALKKLELRNVINREVVSK